ncbi:hypothetical protein LOK49_LG09G00748 [Camellia lanceoleosa]|uniref:Uncharacterized protein n=1 Tax=Camellia lanceoleosa TaxID=1840588 RepID=A0ACC0GIC1_9ERIC|nr:hypothetical protein LOK49_LG09G00748 [Camellia lanceoleosa]
MGLEELPVNRWCIEQGSVFFAAARSLFRCRSPLRSRMLSPSPVVGRDRVALCPRTVWCVLCVCRGVISEMKEGKRCEGEFSAIPGRKPEPCTAFYSSYQCRWKGPSRWHKPVDWVQIERKRHDKERTLEEHKKLVEEILKRDQKKRKKIEAAGIDYECPKIWLVEYNTALASICFIFCLDL